MMRAVLSVILCVSSAGPLMAQASGTVFFVDQRPPVSGTISKDSWQEVAVKPKQGPALTFSAEDVDRIEYADGTAEFKQGLEAYAGRRYDIALQSFEEAFRDITWLKEEMKKPPRTRDAKAKGRVPPGGWWEAYINFYLGSCYVATHRLDKAIEHLTVVVDKFGESRLAPEAVLGLLEAHTAGNASEAQAFLQTVQTKSKNYGVVFEQRLTQRYTRALVSAKKYQEAIEQLRPLVGSSEPRVALAAARDILHCLEESSGDVEGFCREVLSGGKTGPVVMIASSKLGGLLRVAASKEKDVPSASKLYLEAVQMLVSAVISHFPGRGSGLEEEHQEALIELGQAYEGMGERVEKNEAKRVFLSLALKTYREVSSAYPNAEAGQVADQRATEVSAKIPGGESEGNP